jgi:hypothetical protein
MTGEDTEQALHSARPVVKRSSPSHVRAMKEFANAPSSGTWS